jgi:ankyrin repeat protein
VHWLQINEMNIHQIYQIKELLDKGTCINKQDSCGWTLLIDASFSGQKNVAKYLLKHGADTNIKTGHSNTALILASRYNRPRIIALLLKYGADPNIKNYSNRTALCETLINSQHLYTTKLLLKYGSDTTIKTNRESTALSIAIRFSGTKNGTRILKLLTSVIVLVPMFHKRYTKINRDIIREAASYL